MGFGKQFYDEQIDYLARKDVDGLIENHYCPDAELVAFDFVVKGTAPLKKHFRGYLDKLGKIDLKSTDQFRETNDSIFFEATVETRLGTVVVYDAMFLKDGKIFRHYTGVKSMQA